MKRLKSIQPILKKYDTQGSSPILVMANDLKQWVCKYRNVNQLFNELLSYQFAKIWHINLQSYETKINTIFTEDWLKICTHTFREYIQTSIIHKP